MTISEWLKLAFLRKDYKAILFSLDNKDIRAIPTLRLLARNKYLPSSEIISKIILHLDAKKYPEHITALYDSAKRNDHKECGKYLIRFNVLTQVKKMPQEIKDLIISYL